MKKTTMKFGFAFALAAFAINAQADYGNFDSDAMSLASGFTGGSVSGWTMTVTDATKLDYVPGGSSDTLNRKDRGWYAGVTITWPTTWTGWPCASDGRARMQTSRMSSEVSGESVGSGNGLTVTKYNIPASGMKTTTWWAWITPEDAFAANGGVFQQKLTMKASNTGSYVGVNAADFYINFATADLTLKDNDGIVWFPAVATNAAGKVYGDLNVALKAGGTICSVANATITESITLEDGIVYYKNGKTITGYANLTLNGGTYDFNPKTAGWTLGDGRIVEQQGNLYVVKACEHDWSYEVIDNGATFKATCSKGCGYTPQSLTISLSTDGKVYDGNEISASLKYNTSPEEFATQTGATVSDIGWSGDKKSAGDHTASVTIKVKGGATYTISKTATIEKKNISAATVTLSATSFTYDSTEHSVSVTAVTIDGYTTEITYSVGGTTSTKERGTHTVVVTGTGNFEGDASATWTINNTTGTGMQKAPEPGTLGELSGNNLTITNTFQLVYNGGAWWAGLTTTWPYEKDGGTLGRWQSVQYTDPTKAEITVEGTVYTGSQAVAGVETATGMLTGETAEDSFYPELSEKKPFEYLKNTTWWVVLSPAQIQEQQTSQKATMSWGANIGAIAWQRGGWDIEKWGSKSGVKFEDYTMTLPISGTVTLALAEAETNDLDDVKLAGVKIRMSKGAVVLSKVLQEDDKLYTEEEGCEILREGTEGAYAYICVKNADITIPDVEHQASKTVKVGDAEAQPLGNNKYRVREGDTVTITYTAEEDYVPESATRTMTDVKNGDELKDLPVFLWKYVYVEPNAPANTTAHVFTNGVEVASPYQVLSNSTVTVWYEAGALYFFEDGTKSNKVEAATTANPTVPSTEKLPNVGLGMAKIGEKGYFTLTNAFNEVKSGETIELLKDCSGAGIVVKPNTLTDVTVDLGGFTYTCTSPAGYKWPDKGLDIREGNTLTFKNGTLTSVKDSGVIVFAEIYAKVTFDGVTIDGRLVDHFVEFKEGDYVLTNNSGNTILTNATVIAKDGDFAIDTCKLEGYAPATVVVDYGSSVTGKIAISGGNLTVKMGATIDGSLVIVDGLGEGVVTKHNTVTLAAPALYAWNDIADDMQQLVVAKAMIGNEYYPTLDKALKAAKEGETVKLLCGCSNETSVAISDKAITLDENGFEATNICIAATGVVKISGTSGSANLLRAKRPTLFGKLEHGAKATTDKTYFFIEKLDAFYEEGAEVVATTYSEYGEYPESYTKFTDGFEAVTTNGTLYALTDIATDGFTVKYDMTIDLVKAADDAKGYTLTLTNCDTKTTALYVAKETKSVTIKGGAIKAEGETIRTLVESFSQSLTLDGVTLDGSAMVNANATKSIYALSLGNGSTVLTNTVLNLPRAAKAYALYVGCSGAATQNLVTFQGANKITGNILVNAQNVVPVEVAFGNITFDTTYALTVNKYNAETKITKFTASELKVADPFSWSSDEGLDTLIFGKVQIVGEDYYSTLAEAMEEVGSGQTIRLCADVVEETDVDAVDGVTLDLNGHTLTMAGEYGDFTVDNVTVKIVGTNENSRLVGYVWATDYYGDSTCLSICGGTYAGQVAAYGSTKLNIANAIIKREDLQEVALQLGSYGRYGSSYDKNLTATVVNSRITGYSPVYLGGGSLTISNSVLTAIGPEKMTIGRDHWMGGTGDALVIDQVPRCPISVTLEAGTKLQHNLDIGTEQLGWYTNATEDVAQVRKQIGVDLIAVDGYMWVSEGEFGPLVMEKVGTQFAIKPSMVTLNTLNIASACNNDLTLNADGEVEVGGESIPVRPSDVTISMDADGVTVGVKSIPGLTYELVAYEEIGGAGKVVESVTAKDTATTFSQQPAGTAGFYRVRVRQ